MHLMTLYFHFISSIYNLNLFFSYIFVVSLRFVLCIFNKPHCLTLYHLMNVLKLFWKYTYICHSPFPFSILLTNILFLYMSYILVNSGFYDKFPETRWLNNKPLFLTVLEAGKSKIKVWQVCCLVRACFLACSWLFFCSPIRQRAERRSKLSHLFL